MKFKSNIELQAGLKDSSGAIGASGKILSSTGSGVAWVDDNPGITGSGTTNYIPKFTGASTLGNSVIFDDGTNLGLGTTTPLTGGGTAKWITANGTAAYSGGFIGSISGAAKMYLYSESGFAKLQGTTGEGVRLDVNGGTAALTALSGGNVGIGSITPSARLTLKQSTDNFNGGLRIEKSNNDTSLFLFNNGTQNIVSSSYGSTGSYMPLSLQTSDLDRLTILSNGNVGIGTTSPTTARFQVNSSNNLGAPNLGAGSGVTLVASANGLYGLYTGVSADGYAWMQNTRNDGTADAYDIVIQPKGGKVGIGTTSPVSPLSFADSAGTAGEVNKISLFSTGGSGLYGFGISASQLNYVSGDSHVFYSRSAGVSSERMRITSGGNVGIGTTSPTVGKLELNYNSVNNRAIRFQDQNGIFDLITSGASQNHSFGLYDDTNSAYRLFVTSSGNVGIGTTSPNSKLNVSGDNITVSAGYGIAFAGDQTRIMTPEDNVSGALIRYGSGGIMRFVNGSTEHMRISGTGNVGIGTTSPTSKLEINDGTGVTLRIRKNGSNNLLLQNYNDTDFYRNIQVAASTLQFLTGTEGGSGAFERMRITSTGTLEFTGTATGLAGSYITNDNTSFKIHSTLGGATTKDLILQSGGSEGASQLILKANGNTLIGAGTDVGAKLQVNGNLSVQNSRLGSGIRTSGRAELFLNSTGADNVSEIFFGHGNGYIENNIRWGISDRGTTSGQLIFYVGPANNAGAFAEAFNLASSKAATFASTVTATGFFNSSDSRLKNIISQDGDVIEFTWKDGRDNKTHVGYIAQEVQKTMPDAVNEGEDGMLSVNYIEVLVKKIQELENRIKQLEK